MTDEPAPEWVHSEFCEDDLEADRFAHVLTCPARDEPLCVCACPKCWDADTRTCLCPECEDTCDAFHN